MYNSPPFLCIFIDNHKNRCYNEITNTALKGTLSQTKAMVLTMNASVLSKKKIPILIAAAVLAVAIIFSVFAGVRSYRINTELELGQRYLSELDYIGAKLAFEGILKIDDKNVDAYLGLAEIEYQLGMPEEALAIIEHALTIVSDTRLDDARAFYADAIPQPDDVIDLDNDVLEAVLLYTLGKPDGQLLQADLDRVSKIYCAGYMYPQVSITFDDNTFVDVAGYDSAGQFTTDYESVVEMIDLSFDASVARFAAFCRNASMSIDQLTLDEDTMRLLPRIRGLQSLTIWDSISDLSLLHHMRHLNSLSFFLTENTDFRPLFREGALTALTELSIISEGTWSDELGTWLPLSFDLTGIDALTALQSITVESAESVIGLADVAALPNLSNLFLRVNNVDLTQLTAASQLTMLRIDGSGETVLDTSALSGMTKLEYFIFYGCKLTDPTQLAPLTALKKLDLSGMGLTDISFLSGMTQMEYLNLNDNAITDITALRDMSKMIHLEMNNNQIVDVAPLSGKPQMEELRMENNRITALSGLTGLTSLKYLLMYGNPVTTIEAVRDMSALVDLRVDDAQITDWSPADHVRSINTNNDYWGGSPWR